MSETCCIIITHADGTKEAVVGEGGTTTYPGITEDSPGWDCHTMGNRVCGSATRAEVSAPREFPITGADLSGLAGVGVFCIVLGLAVRSHYHAKRALAQAHRIARGERA